MTKSSELYKFVRMEKAVGNEKYTCMSEGCSNIPEYVRFGLTVRTQFGSSSIRTHNLNNYFSLSLCKNCYYQIRFIRGEYYNVNKQTPRMYLRDHWQFVANNCCSGGMGFCKRKIKYLAYIEGPKHYISKYVVGLCAEHIHDMTSGVPIEDDDIISLPDLPSMNLTEFMEKMINDKK